MKKSAATVGDWLLLDAGTTRPRRLLRRASLFKRRAAGTSRKLQLIAANVDTLFIVSSCNQDFNAARLERYLALARGGRGDAGHRADQGRPHGYARGLSCTRRPASCRASWSRLVDARSADSVARLAPWCARGQTVALVGSSGVGKSTLVNTLTGTDRIATQGIREDDDKGRHTTSGRALHRLPAGGWLVDTPGMRELQITDVKAGVDEVFADVVALAAECRFSRLPPRDRAGLRGACGDRGRRARRRRVSRAGASSPPKRRTTRSASPSGVPATAPSARWPGAP